MTVNGAAWRGKAVQLLNSDTDEEIQQQMHRFHINWERGIVYKQFTRIR